MMKRATFCIVFAAWAAPAVANCDMLATLKTNSGVNSTAAVAQCVSQGGDLNRADDNGWTPLHWAVVRGDTLAAKALADAGADVDARDSDGATPLNTAMILHPDERGKVIEFIEILASAGADMNPEDNYSETPLSYVAGSNSGFPVVEELLKLGADPNWVLSNGRTPLFATANGGCRSDIGNALLDAGADPWRMDVFKLDLFARATRILCTESQRDTAYRDRIDALMKR